MSHLLEYQRCIELNPMHTGADTYVIDGADTIHDLDGGDTVRFERVLSAAELTASLSEEDGQIRLVLSDAASGTELAIADGDLGGVSRYEFADGAVLDHEQLMATGLREESQSAQDGEFDVGGFIENAGNDTNWRIAA